MIAFTVDVGGVLGDYTGPGVADTLEELAQAPANAAEIDRELLSVAPHLTRHCKAVVCRRLVIDPAVWPQPWPAGGFRAYPGTDQALAALAELGPVAALPNVSVLGGDERMRDVREQCGKHLTGIYPSYRLRARKPENLCWSRAARRLGVRVGDLIHIGDRIPEDIVGARNARCCLAVLANTRAVDVPGKYLTDPRVLIAPDLPGAVALLTDMAAAGELTPDRGSRRGVAVHARTPRR